MDADQSQDAASQQHGQAQPDRLEEVLTTARSAATQASSAAWTVTREVAALEHLTHHLGRDRYLPPVGGWSIDYSTLAFLLDALLVADVTHGAPSGPPRLLELGSGAGTPWVATIVRHLGGSMVSVEHDDAFVASTTALLEHLGLADVCTVVHAPLTEAEDGPPWYAVEPVLAAVADDPVTVLVVDGPPGSLGPLVRRGALPTLEPVLADGALVLLDDTVRDDEQEVLQLWLEELGDRAQPLPALAPRARAFRLSR